MAQDEGVVSAFCFSCLGDGGEASGGGALVFESLVGELGAEGSKLSSLEASKDMGSIMVVADCPVLVACTMNGNDQRTILLSSQIRLFENEHATKYALLHVGTSVGND